MLYEKNEQSFVQKHYGNALIICPIREHIPSQVLTPTL